MIINNNVVHVYYKWLISEIMPLSGYSYLLSALFNTDYIPSMPQDYNRAVDGIYLRTRFGNNNHIPQSVIDYYLQGPCSMLEMMVALAVRIEENIMYDPSKGDRTSFWFKEMLVSMELLGLTDNHFDPNMFEYRLSIFNSRSYMPNGRGGLFTIDDSSRDMRELEIWSQMNLYVTELDKNMEHINI